MDTKKSSMVKSMKKMIKYKVKKLKPHVERRGWLVELLKAHQLEKPIKQIHIASIEPGHVRGNHYHSKMTEWIFIFGDGGELSLQDIKTKRKVRLKFSLRYPKVVTIFPYISHAVENKGKGTIYLVSAQSEIYNHRKPDAVRWVIK